MKTGGIKWQWNILKSMGISEADIAAFADPVHWLHHFPHVGMQDLKASFFLKKQNGNGFQTNIGTGLWRVH